MNRTSSTVDITPYLSGERLYGDDLSPDEIEAWHREEREAYASLGARGRSAHRYAYHALNSLHGFGRLPARRFERVLGVGSAYGDEFNPVLSRIGGVTILDPSDVYQQSALDGVPCRYVKPSADGRMPFEKAAFDLVTCLGVLHHIPNVRAVVREAHRCVTPGGFVLVREPIRSMGDWTRPRPGLTRRERGIPLRILIEIVEDVGFIVRNLELCLFPPVMALCSKLGILPYNHATLTRFDAMLCRLFSWNDQYHPGPVRKRLSPGCAYLVLERPDSSDAIAGGA